MARLQKKVKAKAKSKAKATSEASPKPKAKAKAKVKTEQGGHTANGQTQGNVKLPKWRHDLPGCVQSWRAYGPLVLLQNCD